MKNKCLFFLPFLILLIFSLFTLKAVKEHSQSWYFQDETEHLTLGWMMSEWGRGLYTDLSSNHQPLPILAGALLAKYIPYNTIFILVERLRTSLWLFNVLIALFLIYRFRYAGLLSAALLQVASYYYFGYYLLAESLVAPVLLIHFLLLASKVLPLKFKSKFWPANLDYLLFGLSSFGLIFNLMPLWPYIFLASLWYFLLANKNGKLILIFSVLLSTLIMFVFVSPTAWYEETIYHLTKYYIPQQISMTLSQKLQVFFYPLLTLAEWQNPVGKIWACLTLLAIVASFFYLKNKISLRKIFILIALWILVLLANNRTSDAPAAFYIGFHLYPLWAGLAALTSILLFKNWGRHKLLMVLGCLLIGILFTQGTEWYRDSKDKMNEHEIQYGTWQSYGSAIATLKTEGETLLTGPNGHGYMNMAGKIPIAGRQLFHLQWAYEIPKLENEWQRLMTERPPEYIFFEFDGSGYANDLLKIIPQKYFRLYRTDGNATELYLLKSAALQKTEAQWEKFEFLYWKRPI